MDIDHAMKICLFFVKTLFSVRPKKLAFFLEIGWVEIFYYAPAGIVQCVSEYIFLISKQKQKTRRQKKEKETKEEKRISLENLTGYDDIVCEFALCALLT